MGSCIDVLAAEGPSTATASPRSKQPLVADGATNDLFLDPLLSGHRGE